MDPADSDASAELVAGGATESVAKAAAESVAELASGCEPRCGSTRVIAIDGPSGAGKTTLAAAVARRIGDPLVLHMDDLYPGWEGLAEGIRRLHDHVLLPLARSEPATYRRFDWTTGTEGAWQLVPPTALLIVEGSGASQPPCAELESVRVWLDAVADLRRARGLARDGESYRPHWQAWAAQERAVFDRGVRDRAHLVVDTTVTR